MEHEASSTDANSIRSLKYLTIQDMIWINLQVTKKVHHFNFAKLEEATFYQYGYGSSRDLARQAGRLVGGFLKLHPFDAGNEATAFVGCAAFLLLNGSALNVADEEGAKWVEKVRTGQVRAEEAMNDHVVPHNAGHEPTVSEAVSKILDTFPETICALSDSGQTRAAS